MVLISAPTRASICFQVAGFFMSQFWAISVTGVLHDCLGISKLVDWFQRTVLFEILLGSPVQCKPPLINTQITFLTPNRAKQVLQLVRPRNPSMPVNLEENATISGINTVVVLRECPGARVLEQPPSIGLAPELHYARISQRASDHTPKRSPSPCYIHTDSRILGHLASLG